jgi:hypothetical protein
VYGLPYDWGHQLVADFLKIKDGKIETRMRARNTPYVDAYRFYEEVIGIINFLNDGRFLTSLENSDLKQKWSVAIRKLEDLRNSS